MLCPLAAHAPPHVCVAPSYTMLHCLSFMLSFLPPSQILGFLLVCVVICLIGSLVFESVYGVNFVGYADYYSTAQDDPGEIAFLQILSTIIVLNTFVPISLYVRSVSVRSQSGQVTVRSVSGVNQLLI